MFLWLILIFLILYLFYRVLPPLYYWKTRQIFHVNPLLRLRTVFFDNKSFAEHIRLAYEEYPSKRYFGSYQFLKPSLFVRDIDLIKQLTVKDFDHFTDHLDVLGSNSDPIFNKNLFIMKGQQWKELRSTLSPAFTSSKMRSMFALISESAAKFTQHFENLNENIVKIEMKEAFSKFTNDVIATCAFGIKCDSLKEPENEFFTMGKEITKSSPLRMLRALMIMFFPRLFQILRIPAFSKKVSLFFKTIIIDTISTREKLGTIRPDLIHLLMEAKKGNLKNEQLNIQDAGFATVEESKEIKTKSIEITDDVITAQALIFFLAGFETSSSLLSFLSYELAKNPKIQLELQKEIDEFSGEFSYENILKMRYLDMVVCEGLRKWTPGFALNRVCTKEYTILPKTPDEIPLTISKGCFLIIPVIGIHHDPKYFENPDSFDPERFNEENRRKIVPGSYLPFGIGPRNCIGSRFALLEIKAVLVNLLWKFEIEFIEKTPNPLKLTKSFAMLAKGGMWLGLRKRRFK